MAGNQLGVPDVTYWRRKMWRRRRVLW